MTAAKYPENVVTGGGTEPYADHHEAHDIAVEWKCIKRSAAKIRDSIYGLLCRLLLIAKKRTSAEQLNAMPIAVDRLIKLAVMLTSTLIVIAVAMTRPVTNSIARMTFYRLSR